MEYPFSTTQGDEPESLTFAVGEDNVEFFTPLKGQVFPLTVHVAETQELVMPNTVAARFSAQDHASRAIDQMGKELRIVSIRTEVMAVLKEIFQDSSWLKELIADEVRQALEKRAKDERRS